MKVGTLSMLVGVHQVFFHSLVVGLAWHRLYRSWPKGHEWVAIFCHDSYWGLSNMDGPEGRLHPLRGARLAARIVRFFSPALALETYYLALYHSREYARLKGIEPSKLCWPDKYSVLFEPNWWYLLRARLSGEIQEFKANAEPQIGKVSDECWLNWYRNKVRNLPEIIQLIAKK